MSHRFSPRANRAAEIGWMEWGSRGVRAREVNEPADPARHLGRVVPLVSRHGRDVVFRSARHRRDTRALRADSCRQRSAAGRQCALQHGRLADDRAPLAEGRYPHRRRPIFRRKISSACSSTSRDFGRTSATISTSASNPKAHACACHPDRSTWTRRPRSRARSSTATTKSSPASGPRRNFRRPMRCGICCSCTGAIASPAKPTSGSTTFLRGLRSRWRAAGCTITSRAGSFATRRRAIGRSRTSRRWRKITADCCAFTRICTASRQIRNSRKRCVRRCAGCAACCAIRIVPLFGGSQDADEEYFSLALESRQKRTAPYVDRTVYTNWNAGLASALIAASIALDDDTLLDEARATIDALCSEKLAGRWACRARTASRGPARPIRSHCSMRSFPCTRQRACRSIWIARRRSPTRRLRACGARTVRSLDNDDASALGNVRIPYAPLDENAELADALLRLGAILHDERYTQIARAILECVRRQVATRGLVRRNLRLRSRAPARGAVDDYDCRSQRGAARRGTAPSRSARRRPYDHLERAALRDDLFRDALRGAGDGRDDAPRIVGFAASVTRAVERVPIPDAPHAHRDRPADEDFFPARESGPCRKRH